MATQAQAAAGSECRLAAALIGGMVSFPKAFVAAIVIGVLDQILFFNFTSDTGLVQFVLFIAVVVLVARVSRGVDTEGESFQFAPPRCDRAR